MIDPYISSQKDLQSPKNFFFPPEELGNNKKTVNGNTKCPRKRQSRFDPGDFVE